MKPTDALPPLSGQWMGTGGGEFDARLLIDLDPVSGMAEGIAHIFPKNPGLPSALAHISTDDVLREANVTSRIVYFNPNTGYIPRDVQEVRSAFPDVDLSNEVVIGIYPENEHEMSVEWQTDLNYKGKGKVERMVIGSRSSVAPEPDVTDWSSFQHYVTERISDGMIYRGQSEPWPLQTSFHRTQRKDLRRYLDEDIQQLHRALTGRTRHIFDLNKPQENGAFLNLAQHHGYPTPLLDWTYSPFVAAYFAYSRAFSVEEEPPVRIFAFDQKKFRAHWEQVQSLSLVKPHFSILEALSIENDRSVPQQGILSLTNLHDIERHVSDLEKEMSDRYLYAFDLPRPEGPKALRHLRLMGITQATLFPGIESICREMRRRNF